MRIVKDHLLARLIQSAFFGFLMLLMCSGGLAQLGPGSMDVQWNEGASNCDTNSQPPLQVHRYNDRTFIIRESLCATFEAPFIYLLVGRDKALLIDTGSVSDPNRMPLASTVMNLLPAAEPGKLPLLVVHTHRHLDHRAGDEQFTHLSNVQVIGFDLDSVRSFYHFANWPNGIAQIDLGGRVVDVIPTPGHNQTEVSFYDRDTGLFFSGDFLMPARLLVDDSAAYLESAQRIAAFARDRPISFVLGGHIEMNAEGELFPWQSHFHPHERALQMTKNDLLALPAVIGSFNGFYSRTGNVVVMNSMHILIVLAVIAGLVLITILWISIRYLKNRIRSRRLRKAVQV